MSAPRNKKMSKQCWQVAVRQVAVRGAVTAFPHMSLTEIGHALGMTRLMVSHYHRDTIKSGRTHPPAWQATFLRACTNLQRNQLNAAADAFCNLSSELYQLANPR
jgi:hypothetical protein